MLHLGTFCLEGCQPTSTYPEEMETQQGGSSLGDLKAQVLGAAFMESENILNLEGTYKDHPTPGLQLHLFHLHLQPSSVLSRLI